MRRKIAILIAALTLGLAGCEIATAPQGSSGTDAEAKFDGIGGTLGSGYGAPTSQRDTLDQSTAGADPTGRIGGTLGSGY